MIITVRRSATHFLFDSLLTGAGWLLFTYLLLEATAGGWAAWGQSTPSEATGPATHALHAWLDALAYPLGVLAVLLMTGSWHVYRRQREGDAGQPSPQPNPLNDDVLAGHFLISSQDLGRVHDSRRTVIHLAEDGTIKHLELAAEHQATAAGQDTHHVWSNGHRQFSVVHPSVGSFGKPTEFASPDLGRTAHALPEQAA